MIPTYYLSHFFFAFTLIVFQKLSFARLIVLASISEISIYFCCDENYAYYCLKRNILYLHRIFNISNKTLL